MSHPDRKLEFTRRSFLRASAMFAVGSQTLLRSGDARAAMQAARHAGQFATSPDAWPKMTYRTLGRTGFEASRLVMGCGATLMFVRRDELLERAFDAGVNVFDVGYRGYYRNAEENLAPFLKKVRDRVYLISKARPDFEGGPNDAITSAQARTAASTWLQRMDESLRELEVDHVDAYYLMASYNPSLIASDEILGAFEQAKQAGKVRHLGLSTHRNAEKVLLAAIETGAYDLAMIAITPAGWYDWETKAVLEGSPKMTELRPVLDKARAAGIGLVGMKAARHLSGVPLLNWFQQPEAFDHIYDAKQLAQPLSGFQRSYAYVLANGLDVVNADMQSLLHLEENVVAATTAQAHFA